ncbi:MAG: signal peptide peptidase SppA [Deltaproteobacteria bacterium]|nr:signal peptide peptidase SppA [Deltaproteobacteria bacterium]
MPLRESLALGLMLSLMGCTIDLGSLTRVDPLKETRVRGEAGPKLVLLEIEGVISNRQRQSPLSPTRPSLVARAREALDLAAKDKHVAGLLLRIQSPGGTVAASETLYHEILRWKAENEKPVVAYMQGLATSGGYYVAMAADRVIAHPTSVTGSIGVIMAGVNLSGLMQRFGISDQTLKSGEFKDAGSPLRPMQPQEREQLQSVIDGLHARFVEVVEQGRPGLEPAAVKRLADGRIFTAEQALKAGLVDEIGHLDYAIEVTEKLAQISESQVVMYHRPGEYVENIYSRPPATPLQLVDIDVLSLTSDRLPAGFYYLWPPALQ